jgi:dienelactone hydrolase
MCLGGHLAYRAALDQRVKAAVCYFATDIHSHSLGEGKNDDSLERAGDIKGELLMVRAPQPWREMLIDVFAKLQSPKDIWEIRQPRPTRGPGPDPKNPP